MKEKTLGYELVAAIREALSRKERGKVVRPKIHIAAIRKKLSMTQLQFSKLYHIKLETLRNWEQEKRFPDTTVLASSPLWKWKARCEKFLLPKA